MDNFRSNLEFHKSAFSNDDYRTKLVILAEECSELAQAACKQLRRPPYAIAELQDNFFEEMADVQFILNQFKAHIKGKGGLFQYNRQYKKTVMTYKFIVGE